jgi:hypothetical protein
MSCRKSMAWRAADLPVAAAVQAVAWVRSWRVVTVLFACLRNAIQLCCHAGTCACAAAVLQRSRHRQTSAQSAGRRLSRCCTSRCSVAGHRRHPPRLNRLCNILCVCVYIYIYAHPDCNVHHTAGHILHVSICRMCAHPTDACASALQ